MKTLLALLLFGHLAFHALYASADDDHARARELVKSGEIVPLEKLLKETLSNKPWRILEVELERENGRLVYEVEVIDEQGRVRELLFDARSGELLGEESE